jgi:hypothetical protein
MGHVGAMFLDQPVEDPGDLGAPEGHVIDPMPRIVVGVPALFDAGGPPVEGRLHARAVLRPQHAVGVDAADRLRLADGAVADRRAIPCGPPLAPAFRGDGPEQATAPAFHRRPGPPAPSLGRRCASLSFLLGWLWRGFLATGHLPDKDVHCTDVPQK